MEHQEVRDFANGIISEIAALLGVRPEDIHDRLFQTGAVTEGNNVIAMVQLIEPVGAETHVHLEAGGTRFIARVHPDNPLEMNQPMELVFDLEKINLFSKDGKERLSLGNSLAP